MRKPGYWQVAIQWLAVAGMCAPQWALATPPAPKVEGSLIRDVALRDGGLLLGRVVKPDGIPLAGVAVRLRSGGQETAPATTNLGGYFAFSGLKTGTYQLVTPSGIATYQMWTAEVAPPVALPCALVVAGNDTVRGQYTPGQYASMIGPPLLLGALIAAAIAIPIAVSQSHRTSASGG